MQKIDELFKENDLYSAIQKGKEPPRPYNRTNTDAAKYKPDYARFKLVCWFNDGNKRYFYSYDNKHYNNQVAGDEYAAFIKLLRLTSKYDGKFKNIIIYATLDPYKPTSSDYNCEVLKIDMYGNKKANRSANFLTLDKSVIFDVQRMKNVGQLRI